ncbi:MAG: hypothetical protein NTU69_12405 [Proteobacteria bacterium]|nr:hypothetical protein [Pseudomonadota bacterium]
MKTIKVKRIKPYKNISIYIKLYIDKEVWKAFKVKAIYENDTVKGLLERFIEGSAKAQSLNLLVDVPEIKKQ